MYFALESFLFVSFIYLFIHFFFILFTSCFQVDLEYAIVGPRDYYGSCVLELTCTDLITTEAVKTVTSYDYQPLGDWMPKVTCPAGHFLVAFRMRVLPYVDHGADDVAVTDFEFRCRGPGLNPIGGTIYTDIVGVGLEIGSWGPWSDECPLGSAICSVKVLMESCYDASDCAAINDAKFVCCDY